MEEENAKNVDENLNEEIIEDGGDKIEITEEVEETQQEVIETDLSNTETIEEPIEIVEEEVKTEEDKRIIGKITGFDKLYVRKNPDKESEPIGVVSTIDELGIDLEHSTDTFYKVITSNGLEGYCVKEFVKID